MIDIVILAAGQGTRMKSALPKVLQPLGGKPMLAHVLAMTKSIPDTRTYIVVGHGAEHVKAAFAHEEVSWVEQSEQLGTGHAVKYALSEIDKNHLVLILYGDVPLLTAETIQPLLTAEKLSGFAMLTVNLINPTGYGRILRDVENRITGIVEEKDATDDERQISECNTGIMAVSAHYLRRWLPQLKNTNSQNEYYLTDIVKIAADEGIEIMSVQADPEEVLGANDRLQLAELERHLQRRYTNQLLQAGATLLDPARVDIRGTVKVGQDVVIDCNVIFSGEVKLGDRVRIGPNCVIHQATIGNDVVIEAFTHIDNAIIEHNAHVGPYARLRPGSQLLEASKVGNFVEMKKSTLGPKSKVNHLSYVGDAMIGEEVNIGAGTITCNYDGVNKHQTIIHDQAFIGSNTALVAPVEIGQGAMVGAGSTITKDVPAKHLAIARARQLSMEWKAKSNVKKKQAE